MKKVLITGITGLVGSAFTVEVRERDPDMAFIAVARGKDGEPAEKRVRDAIIDQCEFDGVPEKADAIIDRVRKAMSS